MTIRLSLLHLGLFIALVVAALLGAVIALAVAGGDGSNSPTALADATLTAEATATTASSPSPTPSPSAMPSPSPTPTATAAPCDEADAAESVRASVVRIDLLDVTATGTVVSQGGLALTNEHVFRFDDTAAITAPIRPGGAGDGPGKVSGKGLGAVPADRYGPDACYLGSGRFASSWSAATGGGYALGISGEPTLTTGAYSGQRVLESVTFIQTDTPLNFGNSGGPLFNACGEVVGIVSWGFCWTQGLNFAISGRDAWDFIAQHRNAQVGRIEQTPEDTVRLYYQAIDQGRFDVAYDQFSARLKAPATLEQFAAGFTTTRAVSIESLHREAGSENIVRVGIVVTDFRDGQFVYTSYSGTWTLVRESDQWKLDSANIMQTP